MCPVCLAAAGCCAAGVWTYGIVWGEDYVPVELDPEKAPPGSFTNGPLRFGPACARYDEAARSFDPDHPDLGYFIAEPLPYYPQTRPVWWKRVVVFTLFRRYRCQAKWWCSWPATEQGGTCDPHAAVTEVGP